MVRPDAIAHCCHCHSASESYTYSPEAQKAACAGWISSRPYSASWLHNDHVANGNSMPAMQQRSFFWVTLWIIMSYIVWFMFLVWFIFLPAPCSKMFQGYYSYYSESRSPSRPRRSRRDKGHGGHGGGAGRRGRSRSRRGRDQGKGGGKGWVAPLHHEIGQEFRARIFTHILYSIIT